MDGASAVVLVAALVGAILLLVPGLALVFGTASPLVFLVSLGAFVIAGAVWLAASSDPLIALFQGGVAAIAVALLASLAASWMPRSRLIALLSLWLLLVVLPIGFSTFDLSSGWLSESVGVLDFGAVSQLGLATGAAVLVLGTRPLAATSSRAAVAGAVLAVPGFVLLLIGAEFDIDSITPVVGPNVLAAAAGGALAFTLGDLVARRRVGWHSPAYGLVAGALAVSACVPWVTVQWSAVLGLLVGVTAAYVARLLARTRVGGGAALAAVGIVGASLGMLHPGLVATISGYIYSGKTGLLAGQLVGVLVVLAYALVVSGALARVFRPRRGQ